MIRCVRRDVVVKIDLSIDFGELPVGNQNLGARGHPAELAGDLDFFRLGRFAQPSFEFGHFFGSFPSPPQFSLSFGSRHDWSLHTQLKKIEVTRF